MKNQNKNKHGFASSWGKVSMKNSLELGFYRRFLSMKRRCETVGDSSYSRYGARGIINEWESFLSFKNCMWDSFQDHVNQHGIKNTTLERIDNNGNYSKDNCKWATRKEQSVNKGTTHIIAFLDKKDSING